MMKRLLKYLLALIVVGLAAFGIARIRVGFIESTFASALQTGDFHEACESLKQHPNLALLVLPTGESVLHIAAATYYSKTPPTHEARLACVQKLVDLGADVRRADKLGFTPLHVASTKEIAELFLERGAVLYAKGSNGMQPIHSNPHPDVIRFFVRKGADVNARDDYDERPLHHAASFGDLQTVKLLFENHAELDSLNKDGETPLFRAVGMGRLETTSYLIQMGADLNRANTMGFTPLKWAKELASGSDSPPTKERIEMVELLIRSGAHE
jgi:ankyrin repeat protein